MTRTLFIPATILLGLVILIPLTTPERQHRFVRQLIENRLQNNPQDRPTATLYPFRQPAEKNQHADRWAEKPRLGANPSFWVQIAATRKQGEAQEFAHRLRDAGHAIGIFSDPDKSGQARFWHWVCIGPFASRQNAATAVNRIQPQFPQAFVKKLARNHLSH